MALAAYAHRAVVAIDQFGNVLIFHGMDDETISAHSARAAAKGEEWGKILLSVLDWIQPHHGTLAEQGDLDRAQAVEKTESAALGPERP